jgi:hypothetical protein
MLALMFGLDDTATFRDLSREWREFSSLLEGSKNANPTGE